LMVEFEVWVCSYYLNYYDSLDSSSVVLEMDDLARIKN
jgi:hypothetical protein